MPGGTVLGLTQRSVQTPALDPLTASAVTACVTLGLVAAHEHSILVRMVQPENIFIGTNGIMKLANFELSKHLGDGEQTRTYCGTVEYMSPEQQFGKSQTLHCDLWSRGCLIYELLVGVTPFHSEGGHRAQVESKVFGGANDGVFAAIKAGPNTMFIRELVRGLLNLTPGYRTSLEDVQAHDWFSAEGVNIGQLKSYGAFTKEVVNQAKVWWRPEIDPNEVGRYYYGEAGPLQPEDEPQHFSATGAQNARERAASASGGAGSDAGGDDLPWHWVF